ncbi:hypothetical protein LSM04_007190 [Trypanosoma melophagium]|uniref:uncharacterized protein n=1 Tax=Trypanosoma melophagium TaxID=715481 RepID=UPI003519EA84|nr:hypothetical protein LSM04_007190 [Trypanosoma melophagium]
MPPPTPPSPPAPLRYIPKDQNSNTAQTLNTNTNININTMAGRTTSITGGMPTNTAASPPRFEEVNAPVENSLHYNSSLPKLTALTHTQPLSADSAPATSNTATTSTTTAATTKTPMGSTSHSNGISSEPAASFPLTYPFPNSLPSAHTSSSSSSSSSQQIAQLWQLVQDLTSENAVLQQRMRVLMEGETNDDVNLPGMMITTATTTRGGVGGSATATANTSTMTTCGCSPAEAEALILRIRRLEAALKVEAMEREALEVRLQAQERVLAKLVMR